MTETQKEHVRQLETAVEISRANLDHLSADEYVRLQAQLYQFIFGSEACCYICRWKNFASLF